MHRPLLLGLCLLLHPSLASAQTSALWGHAGELWDAAGRLPDFSYAGYASGEAPLPDVPVVADVTDFGARGDGVSDDAQAFRNAIAYVGGLGGGAVFVPAGTYVIGSILDLREDGVVLRGAGSGPGGTTLSFPNALKQLTGKSSPWINGEGGLLWIGDRNSLTPALGNQLTSVTQPQLRGDRQLVVSSTAGIVPGDFVVLRQTDPGNSSLALHQHNNVATPGNCSWQPLPLHWPFRVDAISGNTLLLDQPLRLDVRTSWSPRIHRYSPVRRVGIEHLTLACAPHVYPGHLMEDGYNPITFYGAIDCWMLDVTVVNADNGPSFNGLTKNCTAKLVSIVGNVAGHHGFTFTGGAADCLLEDFYIEPIFIHGVTVDHSPSGNVIRRGSGTDIYLDHHRDGPFENLFTDIQLGYGPYVWSSGGASCAGPQAGARNTYWNLRASSWSAPPDPGWVQIQSNLIPARSTSTSVNYAWTEAIPSITPPDLYASQLERRLDDEVLTKTLHTVATFEDGTLMPLGQEEGSAADMSGGTLLVRDTALARFVDPTTVFDDQEILFQVPAGLPRSAKAGVVVRASSPSTKASGATRLYLEGKGSSGETAEYVVLRLEEPNGLSIQSQNLFLNPAANPLTVRVVVSGNRLQAWVDDVLGIDQTPVARPAGGGYTSFYADRNDAIAGGTLGFLQAKIHAPGQGTEVHVDASGTIWITLHQEGLFTGAFDPSAFQLFIDDQIQLDYTQFLSLVWPDLIQGVQPLSVNHATFGVDLPLPPGTHIGVLYDSLDEAVVPWW